MISMRRLTAYPSSRQEMQSQLKLMEMREPNLWIQHWTMISLLVVDILHNTWHCYNTCVYKTPSFPFNNMLLSTGYVCVNHICTSTTICTPSDTHTHTNIPTHKQTSTHTHTSTHTSESCYVIEEPFVLCGREALQDIRETQVSGYLSLERKVLQVGQETSHVVG